MADMTINNTLLGGSLASILQAEDIEPGSQVGYELCKQLWLVHPLGGKLVEKPVKLAMNKPRFISMDAIGKEMLVEAFLKEWEDLHCDTYIQDTTFIKRAYGVGALVFGSPQIPTDKPIDPWDLPNLDLYFNRFDPLNLAGSTVTNQNPNAVDFQQPWTYITAAGQPYHPSRSVIMFNGTPVYLAFQSSAFGFTGRSVFLRALYPMKSFIQSMVTDDMVTYKAGLLIAKQKQAGSIVNRVMDAAAGIKRLALKQGVTGNVLSIDTDEDIEAINLQNTDTAMKTARDNIIANIASASDVPAILLKDEAFTQGFGEGTEDARALAQYVSGLREEMQPLYDFFDKIVMHRAWNEEFFKTLQNHPDFGEYYKGLSYKQAFYGWKQAFKAEWENLLEEPESEKVRAAEVKVKNIVEILRTTLPIVDPQNRAILVQWAQDNLNEIPELFKSTLNVDTESLAEYEPPEGAFNPQKMPRADSESLFKVVK